MFFPKEMTEIELIVPSKDLMGVTKVLSGHGVFHQADGNYPGHVSDSGGTNWQATASSFAVLERRVQIILQTLGLDEGRPQSSEFEAMVEFPVVQKTVEEIDEEVRKTTDQLAAERKQVEQLENTLRQLEPISDIDLDIASLRNSRFLFSILGQIPAANVDRLQTSLARVPYVFLTLRPDSQKPVVLLAGSRANADILDRAARSAYLNPLSLPEGHQGVPENIIRSVKETIEAANQRMVELQDALAHIAKAKGQKLQALLWDIHSSRILAEAIVRFGQLRYTYVITGWVATNDLDLLTQRLKSASKEILIETLPTTRGGHNMHIPVALQTSKFLKPFQMLVNTYARPRYGELDPTILIAVTFPLLFGAMFGDIGQGLVLALLGWLMSGRKVKALNSMSSLGGLIAICGFSATFFGFLYGSLFGFEEGVHIFGIELKPLWISPIHNILDILMVAIGAGVVLLILSFLIGIFNGIISREWGHLCFGHNGVAGFLLYVSFLGLGGSLLGFLPVPPVVFSVLAIVSALVVMFSEALIHAVEGYHPLIEGGLGTYVIQAGVELFEVVISFLSNTLSFVRVGAFAVAHGGLSAAIFILAELVGGGGHGIGYWIVVVLGNLFIVGFEGLIVGIQTMRLHYYELLGKFFTGGGMRFEPLALTPAQED